MGDKVASNYDSQIINNIPALLYIDVNGNVDHLESEGEYMEDLFKKKYIGLSMKNYIYPFGKNAVDLSVGDSWIRASDSITLYFDESGTESLMSEKSVYTLDKIKSKRGRKIAYISEEASIKCEFRMVLMGEFMEGEQAGTFNKLYRFDIDAGEIIVEKGSGELLGEYHLEDSDFKTIMYFSNTFKRVK